MSDDDNEDAAEAAFEARYRERRQRMVTQSPRCLAPFAVELASAGDLPGVTFDGHGAPDQSIFAVRCTCGGESFVVRGTYHAKDYKGDPLDFFGDPLELTCQLCSRTQLLFDSERHGYNAEIEGENHLMPPERQPDAGPRTEYACTKCQHRAMRIRVRFEHHAETCEDSFTDELGDGREQEFFTWFTLVGRCGNCQRLQTVTEFECA